MDIIHGQIILSSSNKQNPKSHLSVLLQYPLPPIRLACSRLRDSGEKSFSKKKCEKRAGAGERQGGGACTHFFNGLFRYISSWYTLWLVNCDS